jgi:dihydroflavonol-4-reductase
MKAAITGAGGHVGNNLCRALLGQGATVKALCHQDVRALENLPLDLIYGNVLDLDSLVICFQGVDVVYHLASVISIDGDSQGRRPLVNETGSIYDQSKAEAERIVLECVRHGMDAIIVSPTAIIGPYDYKPSLMGRGLLALYRGSLPALVPGGFNWVDVRDVVQGAIQACRLGGTGERYLLSGTWASVRQIAEKVEAISGNPRPKFISPLWLTRLGLPFIRAYASINGTRVLYTAESLNTLEGANRNVSYEKAAIHLNYHPRSLQETLEDTLQWFRQADMLV